MGNKYNAELFGLIMVKITSHGIVEWSKHLNVSNCNDLIPAGLQDRPGADIIQTQDGGYAVLANLAGHERCTNYDNYGNWILLRTDDQGNIIWDQKVHFESEQGFFYRASVLEDNTDQTLVVAGGMGADDGTSSWPYHVALVKIDDLSGNIIWDKTYQLYNKATGLDLAKFTRVNGIHKTEDGGYRIEVLINDGATWPDDYGPHVIMDVDVDGNFKFAKSFNPTDITNESRVICPINYGYSWRPGHNHNEQYS